MRLTAGLLDVQRGDIRLGGAPLAGKGLNPPPENRPVGLVFQEGALFPHLNVADNIAFGVKRPANRSRIVRDLLEQVDLSGFGESYPHTLSGGQQQRVALLRALAPEPPVLLLDEPFANVDVVLRRQLREDTRRILRARGSIAILVTHDPEEALDIGDRIAVMGQGTIVQKGTPAALYDQPATADVAVLFGQGQKFRVPITNSGVDTPFGSWDRACFSRPLPEANEIDIVVRPEALRLQEGSGNKIEDVRLQGPNQRVIVTSQRGDRLAALVPKDLRAAAGAMVDVVPLPGSLFAFAVER